MKTAGVDVINTGAAEDHGEIARMGAFVGAMAIADLVKSTLGPNGMDKIMQSMYHPDKITVTNDGATILKDMAVDNPAAQLIVDLSQAQDADVGDGTTSVAVLAGQLLHEAEALVEAGLHPQTIVAGWRQATEVAVKALEASARSREGAAFREDLVKVAMTTLNSKVLAVEKEHFAEMAVSAVERLRDISRIDAISVVKIAGGTLRQSELVDGLILPCEFGVGQPSKVENARILIANSPMDHDKIKIFGAKIETDSPEQLAVIEATERQKMIAKCEKILKYGPTIFVNRQLIYDLPEEFFTSHGVNTVDHADFAGVERLALATGGDIVSTFDTPGNVRLGECGCVESILIGETRLLKFSGCKEPATATIVLRGATDQILDEGERALHDAFCVISSLIGEPKTVLGAGASEILMAEAVDAAARSTRGKVALAMEGFARALRSIPQVIASNAGLDGPELVASARAEHVAGKSTWGIDLRGRCAADAEVMGVTESLRVKRQVVVSAAEAAEQILRVDEVVRQPPPPKAPPGRGIA